MVSLLSLIDVFGQLESILVWPLCFLSCGVALLLLAFASPLFYFVFWVFSKKKKRVVRKSGEFGLRKFSLPLVAESNLLGQQ